MKINSKHLTLSDYLLLVRSCLTPDLLKPEYREKWTPDNPTYGFCYVATEALHHLLSEGGWNSVRAKDDQGITHWWIAAPDSNLVADPTDDQYFRVGLVPPYEKGRRGGFLTSQPSQRAQVLLSRIETVLQSRIIRDEEHGIYAVYLGSSKLVEMHGGELINCGSKVIVGPIRANLKNHAREWIDEFTSRPTITDGGVINFASEADLLIFKMRWQDEI